MACLAAAGSIVAGAHYFVVDIPQQNALQAPENADSSTTSCAICKLNCKADPDYYTCLSQCELVCTT